MFFFPLLGEDAGPAERSSSSAPLGHAQQMEAAAAGGGQFWWRAIVRLQLQYLANNQSARHDLMKDLVDKHLHIQIELQDTHRYT